MDTNKILSASLLDIVFDRRNKDYGAYELRNTYGSRMTRALITTALIVTVIILCTQLGGKNVNESQVLDRPDGLKITTYVDPPEVIKPKPQPPAAAAPVTRQAIITPPRIVDTDEITKRMATADELKDASPSTVFYDGPPNIGIVGPKEPGPVGPVTNTTPVEPVSDEPIRNAQVPSKFIGDWIKFLLRNLNPDVPVDNDAPPGRYTVLVQFVVDREGKVSDIKPLTSVGYGMEDEAVRVLRKATKWEPALQNGAPVKAYHKQPITFEVPESE